ncbi:hypothetical protein A3Q56_06158 [Intoshia linei]|uniref:Uncharacterized protein n=1 Tax=Intoshia linei TaxID=1819745 RepID=A0A177AWB5_9BILA|nr:hypothetical protein A3Q56_06158 [Intoshia linei]
MEPEKHTIKPVLPQPYRLIDEIVNKILSSTILKIQENEISTVQKTRTLYAQTTRHTTFEIDIPEKCLAIFSLSNVIICGTCNGLSIYNCETNDLIFTSNQSDVNIVFINAIELSNFHIFISAFDDFGKIYLYIYAIDKLFYLKDIDLNNDKSTVSNVDISKDLSNIVVTYLDMETNLHYLMVYTIPLFNWLREIDTNLNLVKSRLEILKSNESEPNTPILEEASSIRQNSIGNTNSPFTDQSLNQTTEEIYSFTKISLLFNLTTPGLLKGNNASNIINNHIKNKDSNINANGIPHGANHILSDQHLKNRNFIFEKDYKKYMQYLPKSNLNGNLKIPITRFVPPGKLIKSYENRGLIAVWTNHNGVYFYAFNKAKKGNII